MVACNVSGDGTVSARGGWSRDGSGGGGGGGGGGKVAIAAGHVDSQLVLSRSLSLSMCVHMCCVLVLLQGTF